METVTAESLRATADQISTANPKNPYPAIVANLMKAADLLDDAKVAAESAAQMAADQSVWVAASFPPVIVGPVQWLLREFGRRIGVGGDLMVDLTHISDFDDDGNVTADTYRLSVTERRPR